MRYFVQFSYFGKAYHGWQNQPNAITVQQVLEEGLSTLLRSKVNVLGAGRTDAGVHAKEMFAHFDFDLMPSPSDLAQRLNNYLPTDIAIKDICSVTPDAHARFDALERTYEYWLVQEKNPFYSESAHFIWSVLDIEAMNKAAAVLLEYEDFECFSKTNTDVKTFLCKIKKAVWEQKEDKLVFTITADRFLRNMVRAIVGTLLEIGLGKKSPEVIRAIIESKNRSMAGASVPAKGLYLTKIRYPEKLFNE
ncbi:MULTISPECIES: tRNA pseudouridine(38-40) synthase TruA [Croceitalea]|uniref:tRNA pseudouridine synthase A n=1 Tax=Croceitalea vernalis TaxID=3075599 RepID=A0ABU3BJB9_9FLAO|nr:MULTISPECIES: tRNA pseudouridine(38-40) synthase TruA [unclassified Croceitalea]MDT0540416.1 tRNA pseudouridine(38-40) synthase TruA [Croceitalea sp. P059]MDT0622251.1 tRNA pseudouridine(38-40) synthase TruA [Croceitalea sp. P007]